MQQQRPLQQQQYYASQPTQAVQGRHLGNTSGNAKRPGFASRATMVFGFFQFIFGGICVILGITAIVIKCQLGKSGPGIWCGVMFAASGLFGIEASLKKTNTMIMTTIVLSIISATMAGSACIIGIIGAIFEDECYYLSEYDDYGNHVSDEDYYDCDTNYGGRVAVDSILAVVALAEIVIAVIQSVFCCSAYCSNLKPSASMMYIASRTPGGSSQGLPMGVIQSGPTQQMVPAEVEFVPHYPKIFQSYTTYRPQQGYAVNMQPVVTSNQQPRIQMEPQPCVVYQQGQGHQLPQQQHQLQQRQQMLQLQPQQLQHQVIQPEVIHQRPQGQQLPQQHRQQVPQFHTQELQYQPQEILRPGTQHQQLQGWRKEQPQPKRETRPPKQHLGKVTGPDENVNQDQFSRHQQVSQSEKTCQLDWSKTRFH
ncbi:uncharacterized protein [Ptychodera flava]|uniref:uncharacterized protein n=1 Tax=Ptychodera flava TaxID=63121 RepID=UPI00396AA731